jgi:hypothetical protein
MHCGGRTAAPENADEMGRLRFSRQASTLILAFNPRQSMPCLPEAPPLTRRRKAVFLCPKLFFKPRQFT